MLRGLFKAGSWVFIGILLGRLAGFVRETFIAANFGATAEADIAVVLLTLPDVFLNLLVGGALGASLIPEFNRIGRKKSLQLFVQASSFTFILFAIISLILVFNSNLLVDFFSPGLAVQDKEIASDFLKVVIWSIPITSITAIITAFLQANEKFAVPAMGTLLFNGVIILFLLMPLKTNMLSILAYGVIMAAIFRLLSQIINTKSLLQKSNFFDEFLITKSLLSKYSQAIMGGGLLLLLPIIGRILSSYGDEGSMAIFNYFLKLIELPLGAFLTIFSVVLFPKLSELFANKDSEDTAVGLARDGLIIVFIFSISIAINYAWFSQDYAQLLFGWGAMSDESIAAISVLTMAGLISLPAQGLTSLTTSIFNAKYDMKLPFFISLISVIIFIPASIILAKFYLSKGIVLGLVFIYWFVLFLHLIMLKKYHKINLINDLFSFNALKIIIVNLIIFVPVSFISTFIDGLIPRLVLSVLGIVLSMLAGVIVVEKYRKYILNLGFKGKRNLND